MAKRKKATTKAHPRSKKATGKEAESATQEPVGKEPEQVEETEQAEQPVKADDTQGANSFTEKDAETPAEKAVSALDELEVEVELDDGGDDEEPEQPDAVEPSAPAPYTEAHPSEEPAADGHQGRDSEVLNGARFGLVEIGETPGSSPQGGGFRPSGVEPNASAKCRGSDLGPANHKVRSIKVKHERNTEVPLPDGRVYVAEFRHDGSGMPVAKVPGAVYALLRAQATSHKRYAFEG